MNDAGARVDGYEVGGHDPPGDGVGAASRERGGGWRSRPSERVEGRLVGAADKGRAYFQYDDVGAAEAANMAKYAAGEASTRAVDQAVQSMGGNGLSQEYGVASMLVASRLSRIAPVSREMVLNFIAQTSLGLPRSY
jgi:alkylation response protein AidB-like acyl-CoA dehydrogenase